MTSKMDSKMGSGSQGLDSASQGCPPSAQDLIFHNFSVLFYANLALSTTPAIACVEAFPLHHPSCDQEYGTASLTFDMFTISVSSGERHTRRSICTATHIYVHSYNSNHFMSGDAQLQACGRTGSFSCPYFYFLRLFVQNFHL